MRLLERDLKHRCSVEFLDGGTMSLDLLDVVEQSSHLLILDAAHTGGKPGSLVELRKEEVPLFPGITMTHQQQTFLEVLGLATVRGRVPEFLHFIGIQPHDLDIGMRLSKPLTASLPNLLHRALDILEHWGLVPEEAEVG